MSGRNGSVVKPELWDLPADGRQRFFRTLGRAVRRRCPYCDSPGVYEGYFSLRERCPRCGVRFSREDGYFLGAYALNLIVAEVLAISIAVILIFQTDLRHAGLLTQEIIVLSLAVALPIIFFPYSRGAWMALDLTLHRPDPRADSRQRGPVSQHDVSRLN